jgi:single-strand DNA-binding protein
MANMNMVAIGGRLTDNPTTETVGENLVSKFSIAQKSMRKDKEGNYLPDYFDIECWQKLAEFAQKYLVKGTKVHISGRLTAQTYTNKNEQKVKKTYIVANTIDADFGKKENQDNGTPSKKTAQPTEELIEDDLPF